jgi:hypothetical protein
MLNDTGAPVSDLTAAPKTESEMVALVESTWNYVKSNRRGLEYRIKEACHFLGGDQWIRYVESKGRFTKAALEDWQPKPVTNKLVKPFDRLLNMLTQGNPLPRITPSTQDQSDVEAAFAAQRSLHSEFRRLETLPRLLVPAAATLLLTGNVFLTRAWNAKAGDRRKIARRNTIRRERTVEISSCPRCQYKTGPEVSPTACPVCQTPMQQDRASELDQYGTPLYDTREEYEKGEDGRPIYDEITLGQLEEGYLSPLHFYPLPCKNIYQCRGAIEIDPLDVDTLKGLFGSKAGSIGAEDLEIQSSLWPTWTGGGLNDLAQDDRDRVMLKIFRYVPDRRFKNGLLLMVAGGKVMHKGDLDSCDGTLAPGIYSHIKWREIPGLFWGGSMFTDAIPKQKQINAIDAHVVVNRKTMISPQWTVPQGAGISQIDGRPALIIPYNPMSTGGHKPERVPGMPLPPQVVQERQMAAAEIDEIVGAEEIDVSRADSADALNMLVEQKVQRFGPQLILWRAGLAEHEKAKLQLIHKYWTEKRLVRVLGDNQTTEAFHFQGADFHGAQDMTVTVAAGQEFSAAFRKSQIKELYAIGVLGDQQRPEIKGKLLEALQVEGFETEYVLDAKKARRVLMALIEGREPAPALPIDNHSIQYSIFKNYMLTAEFEQLPPTKQQAILQRSQLHQQAMQQEQQAAMMAAQAAKGTNPEISGMVARSGMGNDQALAAKARGG